jgi:hypothetical protein
MLSTKRDLGRCDAQVAFTVAEGRQMHAQQALRPPEP